MNLARIKYLIATGFGCGKFPYIPGTFGSFVALILIYFIHIDDYIWLTVSVIFFALGIWTSGSLEKKLGKDPRIVVIDEFVGQWVSVLFLPRIFWVYIAGFLLFRFLDIVKPFPVKEMEDFEGSTGIMMDDLIAGILVNITLNVTLILLYT